MKPWFFQIRGSPLFYFLCFQWVVVHLLSQDWDAVERQMSHQERNGVRAAYIHKAEHLEESRLMLQWWADYLDANRKKAVSPFDFGKMNYQK